LSIYKNRFEDRFNRLHHVHLRKKMCGKEEFNWLNVGV